MARSPRLSTDALRTIRSGITWLVVAFVFMGIILIAESILMVIPAGLAVIGLLRVQRGLEEIANEREETAGTAALRAPEPTAAIRPTAQPVPGGFGHNAIEQFAEDAEDFTERPEEKRRKKDEPSWTQQIDWEEWVGKKLLQKLGIVIVLIGMVVFLKYSFDNGWIGIIGRLSLGAAAGIALLGAGEFFMRRYGRWAHAFTGGGLAMLYFTVWAADVFYGTQLSTLYGFELHPALAMGLHSAITALGAIASIRYKDQAIAWFAILGGYLTPAIIDAPVPNPVGLSVYLAILAAGVMALAWHQRWKYLNLAAFVLTQLYLTGQIYGSLLIADGQQMWIAIGFFLLFGILPFLYQFRLGAPTEGDDVFLSVANAALVAWALIDALGGFAGEYTGFVLLALAAIETGYAALSIRKRATDDTLVNTYLVSAVVLIALALLAQLKIEWVAAGWAPFSLLLVAVSARLQRKGPWMCAGILLIAAMGALMLNLPNLGLTSEYLWHPFTSRWALQNYVVFASLAGWVYLSRSLPKAMLDDETSVGLQHLLHLCMAGTLFLAVTFEATGLDWTVDMPWTLSYLGFAVVALGVFWIAGNIIWFAAAIMAQIIVLCFTFLFGSTSGMVSPFVLGGPSAAPFVHPWALVSMMALLMTFAVASVAATKKDQRISTPDMRSLLIGTALAQVWLHITVEIQHMAVLSEWTQTMLDRSLSGWWIVFGAALVARSTQTGSTRMRTGAIVALCAPFIKDLLLIMQNGPFGYEAAVWTLVPLALILAGTRFSQTQIRTAGIAMLSATAVIDMLFHFGYDAGLVRTVWWACAALAAIVLGFTERDKTLRRIGLIIFGGVTFKLLIIDFSVLSVPVRIGATIATGLLMIGASYLYQRFDAILTTPARAARASSAPKRP